MTYEEKFTKWLEDNEDELVIGLAESGADREVGFDFGEALENAWLDYCDHMEDTDGSEDAG